jgi:hypothetical protein
VTRNQGHIPLKFKFDAWQKSTKKLKIVKPNDIHYHSLESSCGALSEGFVITILWGKIHFLNFAQKISVLRVNESVPPE